MGVPKFYRWISERYPQINQMLSGTTILPEFDNFYLDMNGIIHACTHPNDNSTANSLTMREMMLAIFRYIDHMVTEIVKPKKILFMAIDGVAPRAKLNQQRARRFRAAQERQESIMKARQKGEVVDEETLFDSNCITPGTEFMEQVGKHLRYFIRKKIKEDPLWRDLKIVFSGHDVPGEGEHKIMQFIRDLRADPHYEPNQRHCMYGQDADLIMLGLATHEPHFALLREVVNFNMNRGGGSARQTVIRQTKSAQFQLLHLSILREYLSLDFAFECSWLPDQERLFDDFIFLTFLVGNDFLPHLPSLDISEHAFDVLIGAYRKLMAEEPGYIVHNGEIGDLVRLEKLFAIIGEQEGSILKTREEEARAFNKKKSKFKDAVNVMTEEELEEEEERLQMAFQTALNIAMGKDGADEGDDEGAGDGSSDDTPVLDAYGNIVDVPVWEQVQKNLPTVVGKSRPKKASNGGEDGVEGAEAVQKDYSGRYYYEKFSVVAGSEKGKEFLSGLMSHYLKGLMWCLAYYIKGCVSWTWYYPFHYGPMLKDMTNLTAISETICFELGQPFMPFQQLLGCLPPASCNLLPRPYQWLMISADSPVLHFYPEDFGIDQDGKKNPWEAVVLLDFIDERLLVDAERLYCPVEKLTRLENARNQFGTVLTHLFDPGCVETFPSCNPEIGLPDIPNCQSVVTDSYPSLAPGCFFKPELVPGTVYPIAGFPSLTILPLNGMKTEAVKINMFGSESKYKSVILEIKSPDIQNIENLNAELLLGRIVYVNYPQIHEAMVVAVTTVKEELRLDNGLPKRTRWDHAGVRQWEQESQEEEEKYLKGRGTPGTGGLRIGQVVVRLRVAPLQGLQRDPNTGASKKVFSAKEEADVPIQMALWTPPVVDTRFEETAELSLEELMPYGAEVVALSGDLRGYKGRIVGPHTAESAAVTAATKRGTLKQDIRKDQEAAAAKAKKRVVDVEFTVTPPEPPFGYSIANSVKEEYYSSRDLCALLQVSASVLGKIVGMIRVEPGRADLGLNLKRNGQYQLLGYSQRVEYGQGDPTAAQFQPRKVWGGVDTVEIVGMVTNDSAAADKAAEADGATWQYTARAAALIFDYKANFPMLFSQLERLPHQPVYSADALLGSGGDKKLEQVQEWMKSQPFFKLPRTPFTTISLSKDAMSAVERAADVQASKRKASGDQAVVKVKNVSVEDVFCAVHRSVGDVALSYNTLEPKLGDRVVNLTCPGVPFGFKGTVVTIHSSTKFVELIFDEEFIGGKGLQGSCSQFRGRLAPWTDLLLVSRSTEFQEFKKGKAAAGAKSNGEVTAAKKAAAAGISPHQVKHVVQRAGGQAPSAVPPQKSLSYAKATTAQAPAQLTQAHANAGAKLLKALQKEDKSSSAKPSVASAAATATTMSPASKVSILKKKIGVVEQTLKSTSAPGVNILAQAAGYSEADIGNESTLLPSLLLLQEQQQALMAGVISYQAQSSSALHKSSLTVAPAIPPPPAPTPASAPVAQHSKQAHGLPRPPAQKLVLNKDATKRIVSHELKPNHYTDAKVKDKHVPATIPNPNLNHDPSTEPAGTSSAANLLAALKKKPSKTAGAVNEVLAAPSTESADAAAVATKPLSMAEKLANAKKVMKEKQQQMAQNKSQHEASSPASVPAPAQENVLHKKESAAKTTKTTTSATGKGGKNILTILKKAKEVKDATPSTTTSASSDNSAAPAPTPPAAAVPAKKSSAASITSILLNAKRAPPSTPAAANSTSTDPSANLVKKNSQPHATASTSTTSSTESPIPTAAAAASTSAPKAKGSSLVPSKVMISKAK